MALLDLAIGTFRAARLRAYGVHNWDDLLEKWVRSPAYLRPPMDMLRRQVAGVVRERQLLFIHVPKNAGTSVSSALYGAITRHRTALFYKTVDPEFFRLSKPFATLREPVDRFISAYWFIRNGGGSEIKLGDWSREAYKDISNVDDLLSYIELNIRDIFSLDAVIRPQTWYLHDSSKNLIVDRLFLLGRDDDILLDSLKDYGVTHLPCINTTVKHELNLTQSQRDRILAIYADDADLVSRCSREVRRRQANAR